jgi:hypothetical protein
MPLDRPQADTEASGHPRPVAFLKLERSEQHSIENFLERFVEADVEPSTGWNPWRCRGNADKVAPDRCGEVVRPDWLSRA